MQLGEYIGIGSGFVHNSDPEHIPQGYTASFGADLCRASSMVTGIGKTSINFASDNEHSILLSCSCMCGY